MQSRPSSLPSVAVVVVNWNGATQSRRCLTSLGDVDYPNVQVCLVDNGSTDGCEIVLSREFPEVDVLPLESNLGYAGGCNAGIARAKELGAQYVLLLNNDTTLDTYSIRALVNRAEALRATGQDAILAPKILFAASPGTIWSAGGSLRWPWLERDHIGLGAQDGDHDSSREVKWASGCALFFAVSIAEVVGPLDERYFLYMEDVDWCLRARKLGVRTWFVPEARLWHDVSLTTKDVDSRDLRYYFARNYNLLAFSHCGIVGRTWAGARIVLTLAKSAIRSAFPSYRLDSYYQSQTRGLTDFLGGKFGKAPYSVETITVANSVQTTELS